MAHKTFKSFMADPNGRINAKFHAVARLGDIIDQNAAREVQHCHERHVAAPQVVAYQPQSILDRAEAAKDMLLTLSVAQIELVGAVIYHGRAL